MRAKGTGGYTLIELLVIVLIIGVLAAIAIPSFVTSHHSSSRVKVLAGMRVTQVDNPECKTKVWVGAARHFGSKEQTMQYDGDPYAATIAISPDNKRLTWETHGYVVVGLYFWLAGTPEQEPIRRDRYQISAEHATQRATIDLAKAGLLGGSVTTVQLCLEKTK